MNKRGLGRGLGALLSSTPTEADTLLEVGVEEIEPNPNQPRKVFNSNALDELSASIKASGVIQPVIVRRQGAGYQLVAGERRWRAARQAGLAPASRRSCARSRTPRASSWPWSRTSSGRTSIRWRRPRRSTSSSMRFGWTQEELAQRVGKERSSIANTLRLLRLPALIQDDLRCRTSHDGPRAGAARADDADRAAQAARRHPRPRLVGARDRGHRAHRDGRAPAARRSSAAARRR